MLVICKCLFGSSRSAGDEKLMYYDIPSFPSDDLPLISSDPLNAPQQEAKPQSDSKLEHGEDSEMVYQLEEILAEEPQLTEETAAEEPLSAMVEEPKPADTQVKESLPEQTLMPVEPQQSEPVLQDLSTIFGLREPNNNSLYTCTEFLGSESCDNMVMEMSEAITEWSWSRKRQKRKALDKEKLANMKFPPPIPRYAGRPNQFMKIKRCDGRITMSFVQMDRRPEQMQIEREDGQIKMQLMTYVGDAMNDDAEASTSASPSQQVVETSDQEKNNEEVEVVTDKCGSGEQTK